MPGNNENGMTPLIKNAIAGNSGAVTKILESDDVDVHAVTSSGNFALFVAVVNRHADVVDSLLKAKDFHDIKQAHQPHAHPYAGQTALHAIYCVSVTSDKEKVLVERIATALLKAGAKEDQEDAYGKTPAQYKIIQEQKYQDYLEIQSKFEAKTPSGPPAKAAAPA